MFPNFWLADQSPENWLHEAILGPVNGAPETFELRSPQTRLEVLAKEAGVFTSSSNARKAGLCGPVPHGLYAWGTKHKRFWTFKPEKSEETYSFDPVFDKTNIMLGS